MLLLLDRTKTPPPKLQLKPPACVVIGENDTTHRPANLHKNHQNHHLSFRSTEPREPKANLHNHRSGIVGRRRRKKPATTNQHPV
jgi:hypothetical protein